MGHDNKKFIRWFDELSLNDVATVGGKNASLGEMYHELSRHGIRVPNGFAVTAEAYRYFLAEGELGQRIRAWLSEARTTDEVGLARVGAEIRRAIVEQPLPDSLREAITNAYRQLGNEVSVAVRSSATAEDLPSASFAGQQETYLNIEGASALLQACRQCFASLFTDRAITYRRAIGYDESGMALSVGVQLMVRSDRACAGTMFTLDTESGFRDIVLINAAYGLGENVVQGLVSPDEYYVFKTTLEQGFAPILRKRLGTKELKLVYDEGGGKQTRNVAVPESDRDRLCLNDREILELARWGCLIEDHYSTASGHATPMDIEWAKDGITGELFIVQARPETVHSQRDKSRYEYFTVEENGTVLVRGQAVGDRISHGTVRVVRTPADLPLLEHGDVLVTEKTDPDWEPYMKKVAAIVTDKGGRTCHAAIVSREMGIPAVVGTISATTLLEDGAVVTVSCAEGETGNVYAGAIKYQAHQVQPGEIPRPRTKIMLNVADPSRAFHQSFIPNDGVGLARMEFIISHDVKIHPMALVDYARLQDVSLRRQIDELTPSYPDKRRYFVETLAMGIGTIAAAFYPKDVIVRFSDFKTNEYAGLIGGRKYEPTEENPMLGFRGASRYYHPLYRDGFALECEAIREVRNEMGLTNLKVMIPFCRTVDEATRVLEIMALNGLVRGERELEIYMMCEIPSNVILAKEFALLFDGFSIGSNDLTQLTLGVDRDSALVSELFDERNDAVKTLIASVIRTAKAAGRKVGICGQAPSDFPDFAEFLVGLGIDSLSLNPDAALRVSLTVARAEVERAIIAR